ncbi:PAS domain S-box-containing protein [Halorubrum xinjiangense]|uniref:PAS domain S-box-containing protein n=1 Tax=Halorubrum xinjiangense TaxID=261291 RepID=A0A1G7Q3X2_9EURY|nr:PAS domain-containing protein [Halorubrum xinjiangense]SDF93165.1 PAS domain S-box-containing protein [Halorubrum xinjiangense]
MDSEPDRAHHAADGDGSAEGETGSGRKRRDSAEHGGDDFGEADRNGDDRDSEPSLVFERDDAANLTADGTVLLLMDDDRDRDLLAEALGERYRIRAETDPAALDAEFDCCVLDANAFAAAGDALDARRERADPAFLPFVLLVSESARGGPADGAWERVDDVIELPVARRALLTRVSNLVKRRLTSLRLRRTVADLRLKERAMDEAPVGITLARASGGDDRPLVYINEEFKSLTGYGEEMLGEDCRFLQGPDTADETRAEIGRGLDEERPVDVDILNYRANGQKFWNRLQIEPLRNEAGATTHFVGFQTEITERKIRERRLEVMARVLNHNLRNKMNLISGYADLLRNDPEAESQRQALDVITETAADLTGIATAVQTVDDTVSGAPLDAPIDLRDELIELRNRIHSRYPDAEVTLSLPEDDSIEVMVVGLPVAVAEAVENAVKHNDSPSPSVDVRVERCPPGWIAIEVADDGPGIPDHETQVLEAGETSLTHADRLGIWLMYWVVAKAGGEFDIDTDEDGTTVRLEVPAQP